MYCTDRICAAFALAALVHENQKRKSTEIPYISHPMAVASQVAVWGAVKISSSRRFCTT